MEQIIECIIAGGPQHGEVHYQQWDSAHGATVTLTVDDGELCIAAAQGPTTPHGKSFILLHPLAASGQLAGLLAALGSHVTSPCDAAASAHGRGASAA